MRFFDYGISNCLRKTLFKVVEIMRLLIIRISEYERWMSNNSINQILVD